MRRLTLALGLCLFAASACAEPAQATQATQVRGLLQIEDPGCVAGANAAAVTEWQGSRATHRVTLWLSPQQVIDSGPVEVDVTERWVAAWIPMRTLPTDAASPATTCIRPVTLYLAVEPLVEADYTWVLRNGTRSADEPAYRRQLELERAKAAEATEATEAGPEPERPATPAAKAGA